MNGVMVAPQVGLSALLQSPSCLRYLPSLQEMEERYAGQMLPMRVLIVFTLAKPDSMSSWFRLYL